LDNDTAIRRGLANQYLQGIDNNLIRLPTVSGEDKHVWHLFVVRCERRKELVNYLNDNSIQTLIHYPVAPHRQNAYKEFSAHCYPITEAMQEQVLSLPISAVTTCEEVSKVIDCLNNFS
jgi:dTDP-4-amino-4,6-dideoxygalactose transaminase